MMCLLLDHFSRIKSLRSTLQLSKTNLSVGESMKSISVRIVSLNSAWKIGNLWWLYSNNIIRRKSLVQKLNKKRQHLTLNKKWFNPSNSLRFPIWNQLVKSSNFKERCIAFLRILFLKCHQVWVKMCITRKTLTFSTQCKSSFIKNPIKSTISTLKKSNLLNLWRMGFYLTDEQKEKKIDFSFMRSMQGM